VEVVGGTRLAPASGELRNDAVGGSLPHSSQDDHHDPSNGRRQAEMIAGVRKRPAASAVTTAVTTSTASITSNPSTEPRNLDDLDAAGRIYTTGTRLRALWTVWSVEVRVFSGALGKPRVSHVGAFFTDGLPCFPPDGVALSSRRSRRAGHQQAPTAHSIVPTTSRVER
jgi:hypothetical protein